MSVTEQAYIECEDYLGECEHPGCGDEAVSHDALDRLRCKRHLESWLYEDSGNEASE